MNFQIGKIITYLFNIIQVTMATMILIIKNVLNLLTRITTIKVEPFICILFP